VKKFFLAIFVLLLCSFSSYAAVLDEETAKKTADDIRELVSGMQSLGNADSLNSPIDVQQLLEQNMKGAAAKELKRTVENLDPEIVADIELPGSSTGFIAQASANWMVTRALLYGFTGLGDVKQTVASWADFEDNRFVKSVQKGTPAWIIAKSADIASKAAAPKFGGGVVGGLSDLKTTVSASDGETLNVPLEAQLQIANVMKTAEYVSKLENVPGIQAGECIYDRSLAIAKILWSVIFVVNIVWVVYKMLIAGEQGDMLTTIFRNVFVFLSLLFLREMIFIGITLSTAVGDAMLGGTNVAQAVSDISDIVELKQSLTSTSFGLLAGTLASVFVSICGWIARAVVYVMFILSDVMVGITAVIGPWMIVLSGLPFCESWASHWIKSYITFLFYRPLACLLCVVLYIVGLTGMDMGMVELMITCIVFVMAAVKVPSLAENMGGAAAAIGAGMAGMVSKGLKSGASVGARAAGLGVAAVGAKLLGNLKDKATPPRE